MLNCSFSTFNIVLMKHLSPLSDYFPLRYQKKYMDFFFQKSVWVHVYVCLLILILLLSGFAFMSPAQNPFKKRSTL